MSKPRGFEKPVGLKDYLPSTVDKLRTIETKVLDCMRRWGYMEIVTPTLEFYDTIGMASTTDDQKLFKLLDRNGTTLVLRSEMTAPIARVISSLLKEAQFPIRLSYHAKVFRAMHEEAAREAEFFQTGVELVGDASADADAEVIALSIATLKAAGIKDFKIAVGHIGFLNGLLEEALPGRTEEQQRLKNLLLVRNYVGYRQAIKKMDVTDQVKEELNSILTLRGGVQICEQALSLSENEQVHRSIQHLRDIWYILQDYGVCDHVLIDLTMIGDFSYYTGMVFEGYSANLGFPVCSGGRYDNLLQQFGRSAPATGFALKTNRLLEIIDVPNRKNHSILVVYDDDNRQAALRKAEALREQPEVIVEVLRMSNTPELRKNADGYYEYADRVFSEVYKFVR